MEPAWHWEETLQFPPELTSIPDPWTDASQARIDEYTIQSHETYNDAELYFQSQESQGYVVNPETEPVSSAIRTSRKRKLIGEEHRQAERFSFSGCTSSVLEPSSMLSTGSWSHDHADCTAGSSFAALRGEESEALDGVESLFVPVKEINPSYSFEEVTTDSVEPSPPGSGFLQGTNRRRAHGTKLQGGQRISIGNGTRHDPIAVSSPPRSGIILPTLPSPLSPPIHSSGLSAPLFASPKSLERRSSGPGSKSYPFGLPKSELAANPFLADVTQPELRSPPPTRSGQKPAHSPAVSSSSLGSRSSLGRRTVIQLTKIKTEGSGSITVLKTK